MRTKDLAQAALLVAIGFILHAFFPPIVLGMKPDFALAMMFILLIIKQDFKLGFLVAVVTGIFTALTTGFPGGQIANMIDKLVTFLIIYPLIPLILRLNSKKVAVGIITAFGTILSGTIFLGSAAFIVGLPGPFAVLFTTVVLPAAVINTVTAVIVFSVVHFAIGVEKVGESSSQI
ncbi:tryptophan transporter [Halanaerobium salsuginis]|uniref:Tryptophan transporter TrpP n=1 Tax=Halanaerobium salsuginis TaxID=29563 RepID=A0A1I4KJS7_9FIRM|nr:tryptophan transporter [Halanaerobium salsuginis]SFL79032.1 Tryptophan transporter TrpP [Halanaerobium salsuginis]